MKITVLLLASTSNIDEKNQKSCSRLTERCQLVGLHFELLLDVGPFFGSENCSVEYRFNRRSTDWTTTPRCIITGAIIAVLMQLI